jgi:hypothetical protein
MVCASACRPASVEPNHLQAPNGPNKPPARSTRFISDGRRVFPARLQNTPAELLYESRLGGYLLPRPGEDELYVIFRDKLRKVDTVYRLNSGNGEVVYYFNNNRQARKITSDRQLLFDVTAGGRWSMDIYRRDLADDLLEAFKRHDLTMISQLLNANPTLVNAPLNGGMTLLMLTGDRDYGIARMAVDAGANVNAQDINGNTPLHYAAYYDSRKIAELLVSHKAYIDARNFYGDTPLHFAVRQRDRALANYLIHLGADSNIRNGRGETPLEVLLGN